MKLKLVAFDLDGTLAPSKSPVDLETAALLYMLCSKVEHVVVISGAGWHQFVTQLLSGFLAEPGPPANLLCLPTSGARAMAPRKDGMGWTHLWWDEIPAGERERIVRTLTDVWHDVMADHEGEPWGRVVEDRGGQVTLSLLGMEAPERAKMSLGPGPQALALDLAHAELALRGAYQVRAGGLTSVDVTLRGLDKAAR